MRSFAKFASLAVILLVFSFCAANDRLKRPLAGTTADRNLSAQESSRAQTSQSPEELVDSANQKIKDAFSLFKQAVDSGSLPAAKYVAQAYEYGIGVDGELFTLYDGAYLYYSIAARFASGSGQGEELLKKARVFEKGESKRAVEVKRKMVDDWFKARPWLAPKVGGSK